MIESIKSEIDKSRRQIRKLLDTVEEITQLLKLVEKGKVNAFMGAQQIKVLQQRLSRAISGMNTADLLGQVREAEETLRRLQEEQRIGLINQLDQFMKEQGMELKGQLPTLRVPPFSLEFDFLGRGEVKVMLGPQVLGKVPLDPQKITEFVKEQRHRLFRKDFDHKVFLGRLRSAYMDTVRLQGKEPGERVRISDVMAMYIFRSQDKRFLVNPDKKNFNTVSRLEFAVMLGRVSRDREVDGWELRLDVASLAQTKDPLDHIWIPLDGEGNGMHFSTMRFVRRKDE